MRPFFVVLIALGMMFSLSVTSNSGAEFHEGFEYVKIVPPQPTQVEKGKVEVVEVFWYGCPRCNSFEPFLKKWLKNTPGNVTFIRIPAQFYPNWKLHAQAYYVAKLLKVEDKVHEAFFNTLHKQRKKLDTRDKIRDFFKQHGVNVKQFDQAFDSFSVKNRLKQAEILVKKYGIRGVPSMIVNGKYRASPQNVDGSDEKLLQLVDYLIKKESSPK